MNNYEQVLKEAQESDNIVGFVLTGSRGKGFENEYSDYDAVMVVDDHTGEVVRKKYEGKKLENLDLSVRTLSEFKVFAAWGSPESWDRYNYAHVRILVDKTGGELEKIIKEKGCIPQDKKDAFVDYWIDGYVNGVYRSVKCIRNGNTFGAHLEAVNSMLDLLTLVFGINGRYRPFLGYVQKELEKFPLKNLPWSPDKFVENIEIVLKTAKLETQQELLEGIEKMCREIGHGHVFDGWEGKDRWAMEFTPGK
jgi:predicted nucleotidyltransferase